VAVLTLAPETLPGSPAPFAEPAYPTRRPIPWLAVGVLVLVIGLALYSGNSRARPLGTTRLPAGLRTTKAPMGDALPNLDSLTRALVARTPTTLPDTELADSKGLRNYQQLAQRYWAAETQTAWLLSRVAQRPTPDPTLASKLKAAREQWQSLNHVLAYDLELKPEMLTRAGHIANAAAVRLQVLNTLDFNLLQGDSLLTAYVRARADIGLRTAGAGAGPENRGAASGVSATHEARRRCHAGGAPAPPAEQPRVRAARAAAGQQSVPRHASHAVEALLPADVDSVVVLRPGTAIRAYGPRAHDGAVLIFTPTNRP